MLGNMDRVSHGRVGAIILWLGLFLACLFLGGQVFGSPPGLHALMVDSEPLTDGRLDDSIWQRAPIAAGFQYASGGDPEDPVPLTQVQAACDEETLYIAVRAGYVSAGLAETIEIFLETRHHRQYRAPFLLHVRDDGIWNTHAADHFQIGKLPLQVAVRRESDWVTVEAAIPFSVIHPLDVGDEGWGFNVIRKRRPTADATLPPVTSGWKVPDRFHSDKSGNGPRSRYPGDFGRLFVPVDLRPYHCMVEEDGEGRPGDANAGKYFSAGMTIRIVNRNGSQYLQIGNDFGHHQNLVAEVTGDLPWTPARFEISLSPGEKKLFSPRLPFSYSLGLTVRDSATGRLRFQGVSEVEDVVFPEEEAVELTVADRGLGYVVFGRDYLERGTRRSAPRPEERVDRLTLVAARGEFEPVSFAVYALSDLEDVRAEVLDFIGPAGFVLSGEAAELQLVESMTWWITPRQSRRIEAYLIPNRPRDIAAEFTQRYWLTVRVPDAVAPGRYEGGVRIQPSNGEETMMPVQLDVLPFTLSPPTGMNYFLYFPIARLPTRVRTADYLRHIFETMRNYGMTTCTLYAYPGDKGTDLDTDTQGCWPMAQQMEMMQDTGLLGGGAVVPWLGGESHGPESWKKAYGEAQRRSWPELLMYVVDEPHPGNFHVVRRTMARMDLFREEHPEYVFRTTTAGGEHPEICKHYDVWIMNTHHEASEVMSRANGMGREVWSYDCNLGPVDTLTTRHYFGLWCWKNGVKGASFWAVADLNTTDGRLVGGCSWRGSEQDLVEYEHRHNFLYPGRNELFVSIGMAAAREGVDDYRYLLTLNQTISKARDAGVQEDIIAEAEVWLKELHESLDGDAMGRVARDTWREFGMKATWYDRPAPDPGLGTEDYSRTRREIADHIIALRQATPE